MADALSRLADLEQRYTGPIPQGALDFVRYGSAEARDLLAAEGSVAFYRSMIRGQVRAIRARLADGSYFPAMLEDLAYYRRGFRSALKRRQAVRARIAGARQRRAA